MQVAMPERERERTEGGAYVYYILRLVAYKTFAYKTCHARASGAEATRRKTQKHAHFATRLRQIDSFHDCVFFA